jgi:hypothetical protein
MAINSTLDVVIQEDDLVVLGPPSTIEVSVDIGPKGDRGSSFFTGDGDPNSLSLAQFEVIHGAVPIYGDVFLRIDFGPDYGTFYTYNAVPGGDQWSPVIDLLQTMQLFFQFNDQAADSFYSFVNASATYGSASAIPQLRFDGDKRLIQINEIPVSVLASQISDFGSAVGDFLSNSVTTNTENGIAVTYDAGSQNLNFDVSDFIVTLTGDVLGQATVTNLGNVSISASVQNNSHDHISSNISDFTESVQDVVGAMVSNNAEAGINVTYDDAAGNLNFDVNDFNIVLYGDVEAQGTVTNLGDVVINTTVRNDSHIHTATTIQGIEEAIEDVVGGMVTSNTENGIQVTYVDGGAATRGKLNFDVGDFSLNFGGDVTGSLTVTNLASASANIQVINDSHTHTKDTITNFTEEVQDATAVLFNHEFHTNISANYDDVNNRIVLVGQADLGGGGGGGGETGVGNLAYTWWFGV